MGQDQVAQLQKNPRIRQEQLTIKIRTWFSSSSNSKPQTSNRWVVLKLHPLNNLLPCSLLTNKPSRLDPPTTYSSHLSFQWSLHNIWLGRKLSTSESRTRSSTNSKGYVLKTWLKTIRLPSHPNKQLIPLSSNAITLERTTSSKNLL